MAMPKSLLFSVLFLLMPACVHQQSSSSPPAKTATRPTQTTDGPLTWNSADGAIIAGPVAFWPRAGGPRFVAAVVREEGRDGVRIVLAVAHLGRLELAAAEPRIDVTAHLTTLTLDGQMVLRADLSSGRDEPGGGLYAMKTTIAAANGATLVALLDRVVEEADATHDLRATLTPSGSQLIVDERENGARHETRRVVYRRDPDGRFVTTDASLFGR